MRQPPELLLAEESAVFLKREYQNADAVLEYGSGGSTVLAAKIPGLKCFSVESDKAWASGLQSWIDTNVEQSGAVVHYADVGKTVAWGRPKRMWLHNVPRYMQYPRSVWNRSDFVHPDVILIDGRFRVGCFLTCIAKISRPTKILFDDYVPRPIYHVIEEFFEPVELVDRMAVFDVTPRPLTAVEWLRYLKPSLKPQ